MNLLSAEDFQKKHNISRATFFKWKKEGGIEELPTSSGVFYYLPTDPTQFSDQEKKVFMESRSNKWKMELRQAHLLYQSCNKATKETTAIITRIENEVEFFSENFGMKIKGYDRRCLQLKVKTGKIDRQGRTDKPFRNKVLRERPEAFDKALSLVSTYFKDSIGSMQLAIDKAMIYAKANEDFYEVAAINIHTLKRHIHKAKKELGYDNLHEFMNHYNQHRKKLAYVKGSFTNDINFFDVFSLDDHKFDVAGTKVWNEEKGEFEQKMVYSWFMVEAKTMYPLAWSIKTTPFVDEDIVRMIMAGLKKWGKPNWKIICDNGLASSERVKDFCLKCDIVLEPQQAYRPTQKATNERIFGLIKEESDIYQSDFVGSNHPVEGRHSTEVLSPEATESLCSETIRRYETYLTGFFVDRPRKRGIAGIEALLDNTQRVSINDLFNYYDKSYTRQPISDVDLRKAYMKQDVIKSFDRFYITFKKEIYLPTADISIVLNDKSYKYTIAYDPINLNKIDLYSNQDITDRLTGDFIKRGDYVCTLESLANLDVGEKQRRVTMYNKKITKTLKELAVNMRGKLALDKNLANIISDETGELINISKEQTKAIESILKDQLPMDKIEIAVDNLKHGTEPLNMDSATSDQSLEDFNNININD